ncbi:hypothetical protein ABZ671_30020 [Micromonospora sp. NPDC006766]|uniref:hypothetical protein n=1 Tax=Micromonospora sp. NPDC006766 TaxID=3154778 RepID=UPI0034115471
MTCEPAVRRYVYVVWFRDPSLPTDHEDHEWPAVFLVDAASEEAARSWGDRLAKDRAARLPVVPHRVEATDDELGW